MNNFDVELQKEIETVWNKCEPVDEGMGLESANIVNEQFDEIARYFVNWTKEQMLKNSFLYKLIGVNCIENLDMDELKRRGINWGDTLRVLILKEE